MMRYLLLSAALSLGVCMAPGFILAAPAVKGKSASKAKADSAKALKYKVAKGSLLRVDVYHTAKHIIAKSKRVKGRLLVKGDKLSGMLSVRIKSLKSGNRRRNRKMWSSLGKSRQPYIYFKPKSIKLTGSSGTVTGTFVIRKVEKKVSFAVSNFSGKWDGKTPVSLVAKGKLKCTDFKVKRPSLLFVKIKDLVDVTMTLKLVPGKF